MKNGIRRRGVLAALIVGVTFIYPGLAPTAHRIDREHFRLIRPGMTHEDVEDILNVPPGQYDWAVIVNTSQLQRTLANPRHWIGSNGTIFVQFDRHGTVLGTQFHPDVRIIPPWQGWWQKAAYLLR